MLQDKSGQAIKMPQASYLEDENKRSNQVSTYITSAELVFLEKRKKDLGCSRSDVLERLIHDAMTEYRRRNFGR